MDDHLCRSYFLQPQSTSHRRYEAIRAVFAQGRPPAEIAARYGYKLAAFRVMISRFRGQIRQGGVPPFLFPMAVAGPRHGRVAQTEPVRTKHRSPIDGLST
jgi:hypothetical protein